MAGQDRGDAGTEGDWDGASYSTVAELQRSLAERSLREIRWRGDESVVDIGYGDGAISAQIAARVPGGRVLGIDASPAQIAYARDRHPAPNLRFEVEDAASLRIPWPADLATSFNALHWVHDLEAAMAAVAAAVRPGGRLLFRMVCAGARPSLESMMARICDTPVWAPDFAGFIQPHEHRSEEDWRRLALAAGFQDVHTEVDDESWHFGSRAGFAAWARGTFGPWLSRLAAADHDAFIHDALAGYAPVAGREGLFRFLQLRLTARRG